ncbi:Sodium/calcium exchanger protein [Tritrichomonas foetus]|uniref:Sodium/calcium exchanger protein n=1 Tax=Tritrichomonas foetus TaxID=1144522 RepID=A0A1J4K3U7_9EUKA|nr:Sodium/calcium exchanger protein [Tritrichomonas foetus]|eukprot:OHT05512.1 Sodium/calcium exchanger protein [Tritrichomonas foetus]
MLTSDKPIETAQSQNQLPKFKQSNLSRHNSELIEPRVVFGVRPRTKTGNTFQPPPMVEHLNYISFPNILWAVLVGWWLALFIFILGLLMCLTICGWRIGVRCFKLAKFIAYPFGYYGYYDKSPKPNMFVRILFYFFASIIFVIPCVLGAFVSWEILFYIPMSKFLINVIKVVFQNIHRLKFGRLLHHNPKPGRFPALLTYRCGSFMYFRYSIFEMEAIYLNLFPFVIICLYLGYLAKETSPLREPVTGTFISIIASIPCMYIIGVCTEIISGRSGLVLGSLINAGFTGLVELILFYFSIRQGLGDVVRAAVTGAFLMNLLVIPGLSMLAAGIKWKEVKLNRKVQSVSGTFLFLAIVAVFFPAVFYGLYEHKTIVCTECNGVEGVYYLAMDSNVNCTQCNMTKMDNLDMDEVYTSMAKPLMYTVSCLMPVVYAMGLFFSLKTHKYIYDQFEQEQQGEEDTGGHIKTWVCVVMLLVSCVLFSIVCEILTDVIPGAISKMGLTERFVGLVFYTLVPAVAEFMNAIRFALEGNMGLSLEIGNQGAMVVSLIQMPALVLMSAIMGQSTGKGSFTLMFEMIDVFAVIISVLLRNQMLMENSINYFTGFAFLVIFLLITVVYYFDPW